LKVAFGEQTSGKNTSCEWSAEFKSSVSSFEDLEKWRQTSVNKLHENVDYVKEFILQNERITIWEVINMLRISLELVQRTMKDK